MWLPIAILGYGSLALVSILDKFILTKTVSSPIVYVFYTCILLLPVWLLVPFGVVLPSVLLIWFIIAFSGLMFVGFLWAMYIGFQKSEVSHVGPLLGAVTPLFVLGLSSIFLNEVLSSKQIFAVLILVVACGLISFEQSKLNHGWHKGMLWGILAGFLAAIYYVGSKYIYDVQGFFSGFILIFGFSGLFGLFLFLSPEVRKLFKSKEKKLKKQASTTKQIVIIGANKVLSVVGMVLVQYAVSLGSVSVVNALVGFQYGFLVILVALLSKFRPKFFREDYTKLEVVQETVAVMLIVVGLSLLV